MFADISHFSTLHDVESRNATLSSRTGRVLQCNGEPLGVLLLRVRDVTCSRIRIHVSESFPAMSSLTLKLYGRERQSIVRQALVMDAEEQANGTFVIDADFAEPLLDHELSILTE
ncbi:MAG: hypothetical protein KatS3mg105_4512 [Gemmatales bacterium]|nr:MAG: hypothetical protein KatS3mg105_4512 [Gemmatales bacterium]